MSDLQLQQITERSGTTIDYLLPMLKVRFHQKKEKKGKKKRKQRKKERQTIIIKDKKKRDHVSHGVGVPTRIILFTIWA